MLAPVRTAPPANAPVTLAEVKLEMHIQHDEDNDILNALIAAAVSYLDGWSGILGRCMVTQTWRQDYDSIEPVALIPLGPVAEIVSVTDGEAAVDPSKYILKRDAGGRDFVVFASGASPSGEASITYKAGKDEADDTDRLAIIMFVKMNYLPLKPEDLAQYRRTFNVLAGVNRKVGM